MTSPQGPAELAAYVKTLPVWNDALDDDPVWMRPVTDYGWTRTIGIGLVLARRIASVTVFDEDDLVDVDPNQVRYTVQGLVNLAYVNAYVQDRGTLVDPDGWFGQGHPVVTPHRDGYAALDGTHRVTADRLADRPCRVFVVDPGLVSVPGAMVHGTPRPAHK
mgnify:CR=1 FL=1